MLATHGVRIYLEDVLVKGRIYAYNVSHLMVYLQLERRHWRVKVDSIEVLQKEDLRVPFPSVTGLGRLGRLSDLHDDHISKDSTCGLEDHVR